ncbi:MAG: peptidoglycan-binding domain-containing protein [Syntrophomonas sp.]
MIRKKTAMIMTLLLIALMTMLGSAQASAAETNLSWGSTGAQVSSLQTTLNTLGYWCGTADGIFGAKTYEAVIRFQQIMECLLQAW